MKTCTLAAATGAHDHRALAALAREIWHEHYPGIIGVDQIEYMLATGYSAQTMAAEQSAGTRFVLARIDNADVGFASVSPDCTDSTSAWLDKLYVKQTHRGGGVGQRLLAWAADTGRALHARSLCLRVNRDNTGAVAIYRKAGFTVLREHVKPIGRGFVMDDYIMACPLAAQR